MQRFPHFRNFFFRCLSGGRGTPFRIKDHLVRLDESLRRWNVADESQVQEVLIENLGAGDCFVDVGANFGLHSILGGKLVGPTGEVHAFEPLPSNLKMLRRHIQLNHLEKVVQVAPCAVSDSLDKEITFFSGAEDGGVTASLAKTGANPNQVTVANIRLDDYLPQIKRPIRLLKIDVEGAELKVLRGAQKLLDLHHPILVIEVHVFAFPDFGTSLEEFKGFLINKGYIEAVLDDTTLRDGLHYQAVYWRKENAS